jgi:glucokinase
MGDQQTQVLALDFGGTKLAAAVVDTSSGELCSLVKESTPIEGKADASIQLMFSMGKKALAQCSLEKPTRVGISFGGPVALDRKTVLMSNHVPGWEDMPLPQMAADYFHAPAAMDNDANAAALGSWWFDARAEPDCMVYIQISTGIGSGLILNRQLYRGGCLAGELGHITMLENGPLCVCGKHGCLESISAGWAIAREGQEAFKQVPNDSPLYMLCDGNPQRIDARLVVQAYRLGDEAAKAVITKAFTALGIAIANVISLLDPQMIILGGGVARAEAEMRSVVEAVVTKELHPLLKNRCKLSFSRLEGKETLLGAALLEE